MNGRDGAKLPPGTFPLNFLSVLSSPARLSAHDGRVGLSSLYSFCIMVSQTEKTPIYTFDGEQTVLQPTSSSSLSRAPRRAKFCGKWRITCSAPVGPQSGGQEGRLCSLLYSV